MHIEICISWKASNCFRRTQRTWHSHNGRICKYVSYGSSECARIRAIFASLHGLANSRPQEVTLGAPGGPYLYYVRLVRTSYQQLDLTGPDPCDPAPWFKNPASCFDDRRHTNIPLPSSTSRTGTLATLLHRW